MSLRKSSTLFGEAFILFSYLASALPTPYSNPEMAQYEYPGLKRHEGSLHVSFKKLCSLAKAMFCT